MQVQADRIVGIQRMYEAIPDFDLFVFGDIGSEQPIKKHREAAVIAVKVSEIGAMVHSVARRRIQYPFHPRQSGYPFAVDKELIEEIERNGDGDCFQVVAQPQQWREEQEIANQLA